MRRDRPRIGVTLSLAAILWLAFVPAANAYIEPGSTAVIFQAAVAGLATAGLFLRVFWRRITNFFRRGSGEDEGIATEATEAAVAGDGDVEGDARR